MRDRHGPEGGGETYRDNDESQLDSIYGREEPVGDCGQSSPESFEGNERYKKYVVPEHFDDQ